jgi:hypothetical protein
MKLLTKEIVSSIPALLSQDGSGDKALCVLKFFTPGSSFTWYVTEGGPTADGDFEFFGKVVSNLCPEGELGSFVLSELESMGPKIERDLYWSPKPLKDCK